MSATQPKIPGPDHPIAVTETRSHVVVRVGDHVVADTTHALEMREASHPAVLYVPRADLDASVLNASETTSYCPYKGQASYQSIAVGDTVVQDAIWYYESPYEAVDGIVDHVAFYPDRVAIEVTPAD